MAETAQAFLAKQSHTKEMSDAISAFMKKYGVGESEFGKLMDITGTHVTNHRLYGHHLIFDFPSELGDIPDFLLHELSDLFTNYGLPILPSHVVENTKLYTYCKSITAKPHWNMINGFDILVGTLAIYQGFGVLDRAIQGELIAEDISTLANTFGVGALEFALALSTANPLLLIGCLLHLCAGMRAVLNEGATLYFKKVTHHLVLEVELENHTIDHLAHLLTVETQSASLTMDNWSKRLAL